MKSILRVRRCSAPTLDPSADDYVQPEFQEKMIGGTSCMVATNLTGAHMLGLMDWLEADYPDNE